jgi:hypothetical protein
LTPQPPSHTILFILFTGDFGQTPCKLVPQQQPPPTSFTNKRTIPFKIQKPLPNPAPVRY